MGGHAFLKHTRPLPTPRMPLEIYNLVLTQILIALRKHYAQADSPIEAPEKETYGDVDILVTGALDPSYDPTVARVEAAESLAKLLGARAFVTEKGNPTINLALPWPNSGPESGDENSGPEKEDEKFVQIDVHYCPDEERFNWELFHSAHGDLWNMLGSTIRPLGLTVNDKALVLRIEAIEKLDKKKSYVFLTSDPKLVLEFLGLDESKWWDQFPSRQAMFEYAASSRCFWVKGMKEEGNEEEKYGDVIGEVNLLIAEGQQGGEKGKKKLKHNDRQRMSKRPIFAEWIDDFIPSCQESGKYTTVRVSREQIKEEAFEMFGVREEYESRLKEWNLMRHKDELWRVAIKDSVPVEDVDFAIRAAAIRLLKSVIVEGESVDGVEVPNEVRCNESGYWDLDAVKLFVQKNWYSLGVIGLKAQEKKAMEGMKAKEDAKRKREGEILGKVAAVKV